MSNDKPLKILACGDVKGHFSAFYKRVKSVYSKAGPFEMVLCVGDFFGEAGSWDEKDEETWRSVKAGKEKIACPLYLLGPVSASQKSLYPDIEGCELAEDVVYLGKAGSFSMSNGLTVAYASPGIDFEAVKSLEVQSKCDESSFHGVDILLTSDWPKGLGSNDGTVKIEEGEALYSRLAVKLRPRYHFSGSREVFYERVPYRNHRVMAETTRHVTRFIGLADVANAEKKKWIYAFNIVPIVHAKRADLIAQPPTVTELPYKEHHIKAGGPDKSSQYFYDMNAPMEDQGRKRRRDRGDDFKAKRPPPKPTGPCWFCLSSSEVEKHLVVSIGDHSYMALPKGPLNDDHVLILPIAHHASSLDLPQEVDAEIQRFKSSLRKLFKKEGLCTVFFERNYRSHHMQLQAVGVPKACSGTLRQAFVDFGSSMQIQLDEVPGSARLDQLAQPGTPFFHVELPDTEERLHHRVRTGFPIQFGREVLACPDLLDIESRIDWRECKVDPGEEAKMAQRFRQRFKPVDFTLDDDDDDE